MSIEAISPALRKRWRNQRGAELVEFAIVSVVFFMTLFGIMEFGRVIWQRNVLANAVKQGVRWASVRGVDAADAPAPNGGTCGATDYTKICQATTTVVSNYVKTKSFGLLPTVTTTWNPADMSAGSVITVRATLTFTPLVRLLNLNKFASWTIQSQAQMIVAQ